MGEWKIAKLGDVGDITSGQGAPQGEQYYSDIGIPFIKAGHLLDLTMGKKEYELKKIEDNVAKKHRLKKFPKDTILFAKSGMSCLKGYVYQLENDSYVVNHLACVTPNNKKIYPAYLKYYFMFFRPNRLVIDESYPSIRLGDISNMDILLPPIVIQQKIVEVLDISSTALEKRRAQIDKLDLLVKTQFIEIFGDPVTNPMRWEYELLEKLGELNRGVSKHRPRNDPKLLGGDYPLIQTGDVANAGLYIIDYKSTYTELGLKQSKLWPAKTLCITIAANIAKTSILKFDACFPDSIVGFISNSKTNNIFINYWFNFFQKILEKQAPESAQKNINLKILRELLVINPPIELQNEFAAFVHEIESQKSLLQESLVKLELNYKSLVQKCFRGEIA